MQADNHLPEPVITTDHERVGHWRSHLFASALRLTIALSILAPICVWLTPSPANAQANPSGSLQLLDQSNWVTGGAPFVIHVSTSTTLQQDQTDLVVTVFGPVGNRSQFNETLNDHIAGTPVILERRSLKDIVAPDGTAEISLPVQDPLQRRYYLRTPGIYPVRVDLRRAGTDEVIDRFVTHLVNEPQDPQTSHLAVSVVLPVQAPLPTDPGHPLDVPDHGAAVSTIANAAGAHPNFPASFLVEPETLERLGSSSDANSLAASGKLRQAIGSRPVIRTTWAPLPPAMRSADLAGEVGVQQSRGASVLDHSFDDVDTQTWAATEPLDPNAVAELKTKGYSRLIVQQSSLIPRQQDVTLAKPFTISSGKNRPAIPAAQADTGFTNHFTDPGGPVLAAHRLLADLAVVWNDRPAQQRSVLVMPPLSWTPDAGFLETMLMGIETSPVLQPASLDQFFATPNGTGANSPLAQQLAAIPKSETQGFPTATLLEERKRLDGFTSTVLPQNKLLDELQRQLLETESAGLDSRTRTLWLDSFKKTLDDQLDGVRMPSERSIRLTARQGELPVSVQNDNGYPMRVTVQLTSNKLSFPQGNTRTIDVAHQFVTERFAVLARTSGAFPVQVRVESPDGNLVLQHSRITVTSTATSAIGIGLSIGAGTFLVVWWVRSLVKNRRHREPGPAS